MAANRLNFLVIYKEDSQVYGSGSEEVALASPPPPGQKLEDKRILFISYRPDTEELVVHKLPDDTVLNAEIREKKKKEEKE